MLSDSRIEAERAKYEEICPMPAACIRVGNTYAATTYGDWVSARYISQWEGWLARAALDTKSDGEIRVQDDDAIVAGSTGTSGKNIRLILDFFFPFGRPVEETLERLCDHLAEHPMPSARNWAISKGKLRMCPCGNCDQTWDEAVRDLMSGPAAFSRDQAEARLEEVARKRNV